MDSEIWLYRKKVYTQWQGPYMTCLHVGLTAPIVLAVLRTRIMAAKYQLLKNPDICWMSYMEHFALSRYDTIAKINVSKVIKNSDHLKQECFNMCCDIFLLNVGLVCLIITFPIWGLIAAEWRVHAAAASIIRNISASL